MRFIQSRLPSELYEWLRLRGFLRRQSMNSIIVTAVEEFRVAVDSGAVTPSRAENDRPEEIVKYNVRVEDDLYEWLRTTAFYARLSINLLLVQAVARYKEAQPEMVAVPPSFVERQAQA